MKERQGHSMELDSHFAGLLSNIEPDSDAVKAAKDAHEELRKLIKDDDQISQANPESYLSGSYARHTAIKDIKDVDIIVLLDLNIQDPNTQPHTVIAWVQASLQKHYSKVRSQGRSIQVIIADVRCRWSMPSQYAMIGTIQIIRTLSFIGAQS